MWIKEERVRPASTYFVVIRMKCDLCGRESTKPAQGWEENSFQVEEIEISHRSGEQYPESGSGDKIEIHLCPECFRNKLVPWLQSQGADVKYEEWDY